MRQKRKAPAASPPLNSTASPPLKPAVKKQGEPSSQNKDVKVMMNMTIDTSELNKRLLQEKETSPKCCPSPPKRKATQEHRSSPQSLETRQLNGPSTLDITTSIDRTDRKTRTFTYNVKCDATPREYEQSRKQEKYHSETSSVAEAGKRDSPAVVVAATKIVMDSNSASWDSFLSLAAVAAGLSDSKDYEHPHRPVTPPVYPATLFENKAPLTVAPGYALKAGLRLDLGETKDGQVETKAKCSRKSNEDYSCSPLASRLSNDFSSKLHCASFTAQANMAAIATVASPIRATTRKRGCSRLKKGRSSNGAVVAAGGTSSVRDAEKFKNFNLLELAVEQFTKASAGSTSSEGNANNPSSDSENDGYIVCARACVCVACSHFMFLLTSLPCAYISRLRHHAFMIFSDQATRQKTRDKRHMRDKDNYHANDKGRRQRLKTRQRQFSKRLVLHGAFILPLSRRAAILKVRNEPR